MARGREGPRTRCAPAIAIGALTGLLLTSMACDRWEAPFRLGTPDAAARLTARTPLPASSFRVRWEPSTVPAVMAHGSSADARIVFTNLGDVVWPDVAAGDPAAHNGGYAVRLAYGWTPASAAPPP